MRHIGLFSMAVLLFVSCGKDHTPLIQEKVAERVNEFRKREMERCRQDLLAEAERLVDSLLMAEAMAEIADSLRRLRPPRPVKPPLLPPLDSSAVEPIFESPRQ